MAKKKHGLIKIMAMYIRKTDKHDTFGLTAEMSFYLLTAMFPFCILLFVIATQISDNMKNLLLNVITYLPRDMENMLTSMLLNFKQSLPIIITAAVFGIWYLTSVITTITKALNRFYEVKETRGYFRMKGMCMLYALFIVIIIIMSFALIIFGEKTQLFLEYTNYLPFISQEAVWPYVCYFVTILTIFFTILIMFKNLPNKKLSAKAVAAGAALTTLAWCIASYGFAFYVNSFGTYHVIYGSLTSIIVLITWVYITAFVILFGGSINAFWYRLSLAKKISKARKASQEESM